MTLSWYLVLAAILFTIGAVGVLVRRNAIVVFMCVELMLNSVNLTLVTFARANGSLDGQIMAFFVMGVAAAAGVGGPRPHRHPRRPDHGLFCDGRRGSRSRRRPRDHHVDLPAPPVRLGRRRQP